MAESFDPYHKWLGIPPSEQPPNHYRLLGITLFESDPDVISGAADRQMTHVRTFQAGPNSAVSQRILNEISAARLCLLDVRRREAYNRELGATRAGQRLAAVAARPPIAKPAARPAMPQPTVPQVTLPSMIPVPLRLPHATARQRNKTVMIIAATSSLLVLLLVLAYLLTSGMNDQPVVAEGSHPAGDNQSSATSQGPSSSDARDEGTEGAPAAQPPIEPEPDEAQTAEEPPKIEHPAWTDGAVLAIDCEWSPQIPGEATTSLRDLSGHGNHAAVFGAKWDEGKVGKGVRFGEAEGFLECENADSLNPSHALTVAIWAKADVAAGLNNIVSKDDWEGGPCRGYVLRAIRADHFNFTVGASGWHGVDSSGGMQMGRWYHLAGVYDGKAIRLYLDGSESGTSMFEGEIEASRYKLRFGSCQFSPERRFVGVIDEVALWDRALSAAEVRQIYDYSNQGRSYCQAIRDAVEKTTGLKPNP